MRNGIILAVVVLLALSLGAGEISKYVFADNAPFVCGGQQGCYEIPIDELPPPEIIYEPDLNPTDPDLSVVEPSPITNPLIDTSPVWSNDILKIYSYVVDDVSGKVTVDYEFKSRTFQEACNIGINLDESFCWWATEAKNNGFADIYGKESSYVAITVVFNHPEFGSHGLILHQGGEGRRTVTMDWVTGTRGCDSPSMCPIKSVSFQEYFFLYETDAYLAERFFVGIVSQDPHAQLNIFSNFWTVSNQVKSYKVPPRR